MSNYSNINNSYDLNETNFLKNKNGFLQNLQNWKKIFPIIESFTPNPIQIGGRGRRNSGNNNTTISATTTRA